MALASLPHMTVTRHSLHERKQNADAASPKGKSSRNDLSLVIKK